jgi:hypothetical protein
VEGFNEEEIKARLNIRDRNFSKYMLKLRDRVASGQKARLREYYELDVKIARGRFLADKRWLREIINNPETSEKTKLSAIKVDVEVNTALLKLQYEGTNNWDYEIS